jgi:hypothetical protein
VFYYYGAKSRYAGRYRPPEHRIVVEPFAGAAGYSVYHLVKKNIDGAILIEKDPRVVELWRRLLRMSPSEVLDLQPPAPGEYTTDFLWMTLAASNALARIPGYGFSVRAAATAQTMLARIAKMLPHVQGKVIVIEGDYSVAPDIKATWFIDPPYQSTGLHPLSRGNGYAKGCDTASMDYDALAPWCRSRRGNTIVCEYEGATWLPFHHLHHGYNSIGAKKIAEVVWERRERPRGRGRSLNGDTSLSTRRLVRVSRLPDGATLRSVP